MLSLRENQLLILAGEVYSGRDHCITFYPAKDGRVTVTGIRRDGPWDQPVTVGLEDMEVLERRNPYKEFRPVPRKALWAEIKGSWERYLAESEE